jgi:uncharacterized membrane protein
MKHNPKWLACAVFLVLLAVACTLGILLTARERLGELVQRDIALVGFLVCWPAAWFSAQIAMKTKWRRIWFEAVLLLPFFYALYMFLANFKRVTSD